MKNKIVEIEGPNEPIKSSPGFAKKLLSEHKCDVCGSCAFGCRYCSSNSGNYLRVNRERFADQTEEQLGERIYPADDPALMFRWPGILEKLEAQLARKQESWGEGQTLVYSMLTDGFSPPLVRDGTTRAALEGVLLQSKPGPDGLSRNPHIAALQRAARR